MAPALTASQKMQLIKSERHLFSSSDDSIVMKQILATHAPDGREINVRPILQVVEDLLQRATPTIVMMPQAQLDVVGDKLNYAGVTGMLEALAYTIHKISCEITCKCSGAVDGHATAVMLCNSLSSYTWDAKVVLALAAFATSYGDFWLPAQLHTVNPLAKSIALLKQIPNMLEHADVLKPRFDAVNNLIKAMIDVTKCIIEFTELPSEYISSDIPEMSKAMTHIPTAVYWTIRSIITCASQIIGLIGLGHEYISSTTETWELSSLAHKLNNIHGHLIKQLGLCHRHIDDAKQMEAYQTLVRLFDTIHIDNMRVLKALMSSKDEQPLFDGSSKRKVSVEVLRRKIVMLYISDLDISHEELVVLVQFYSETLPAKTERSYEIVWLPITDRHLPWSSARDGAFNRLVSSMPWYSLHHPSLLDSAVIKYVRDVWRFDKKSSLVVLDPQGKVVCRDAFHMLWIWGNLAFPFTSAREEDLWKEETWRMEFLVDEIDPLISAWIREDQYVCLYGGEDINWIRSFTTVMRHVAQEAKIPLEMVYVGKSNPKERVKKVITVISAEKLSGYWDNMVMMWFFWVRLESMWHSKMQHGKTIESDPIMQQVMSILSFDGSDEGWMVLSRGLVGFVKAQGKKIIECLQKFDAWKASVEVEGFITALTNALLPYHTPEHCTRLILPGDTAAIKERVVCAECGRPMDKYVLYRCCND